MKKLILTTLIGLLALSACDGTKSVEKQYNGDDKSLFVEVEMADNWIVVYHRDTKVMYAVSSGDHSRGIFTLLVDAEGKPLLYDGDTSHEQY